MVLRANLHARSVTRHWIALAGRDQRNLILLSPYLTARIAEKVAARSEKSTCRIFTVFTAENFATGASSLSTIKTLVSNGYSLFHIEGLHAKAVLGEGGVAVGSQNLTAQGARNK